MSKKILMSALLFIALLFPTTTAFASMFDDDLPQKHVKFDQQFNIEREEKEKSKEESSSSLKC